MCRELNQHDRQYEQRRYPEPVISARAIGKALSLCLTAGDAFSGIWRRVYIHRFSPVRGYKYIRTLLLAVLATGGVITGAQAAYAPAGNGDMLTGQFSAPIDLPITIVVWVNRSAAEWDSTSGDVVMQLTGNTTDQNDSISLRLTSGAADRVSVRHVGTAGTVDDADLDFTANAYNDLWVPVIGVFTSDSSRDVYIESSSNTAGNTDANALADLEYVTIGCFRSTGFNCATNTIFAEAAVFNKALSTAEINALQSVSETGPSPCSVAAANCIGYWPLSTDQATHADESGNGGPTLTVESATPYSSDHPTIEPPGITLTSIGAGSPCTVFNTAVDPDLIANDILVPTGYPTQVLSPGVLVTHNGADNAATLSDSTLTLTVDHYINYTITNDTDGSSCTVTDNDGTTITCTLAGGTDNDWDIGDTGYVEIPLTIGADCQFSYDDGGQGTKQSLANIAAWDNSVGAYHAEDIDFFANNSSPECDPDTDPTIFVYTEDAAAAAVDFDDVCADATDGDVLTWSFSVGTASNGMSLNTSTGVYGGTPDTENEAGKSLTAQGCDDASACDTFDITEYIVNTFTLSNVVGLAQAAAVTQITGTDAPWRDGSFISITPQCDATQDDGEITVQSPVATSELTAFQQITLTVHQQTLCDSQGRGRIATGLGLGINR